MRPGQPSVTARWVAAQRARLAGTRPSTPGGEPEAELALDRDVRGFVAVPLGPRNRLDERTPGIRNRLVDSGPTIRQHINVYVDHEPAGLETAVRPESTIHVIPAVSGG